MRWNDEYGQALAGHQPMLDRIDMNINAMTREIVVIANRMSQ